MKKLSYLLLSLFALVAGFSLTACGGDDDNDSPTPPAPAVTITPSTMSFTCDGGSQEVTVSVADLYVKSEATWITVSKKSSTSSSSVYTVTCQQNTTTDERKGSVLFNYNNGTPVRLNITQAGKEVTPPTPDPEPKEFRTAMETAKDMYPGINLGNTLEAGDNAKNWTNEGGLGYETFWQKTKTTQEIINYYKQQGFKSVRVPVAWVMGHITDKSKLTIDKQWMARVKEIVDYCIKADMYVIINDHWDGGWLENNISPYSSTRATQLKTLWTNIANEFESYDAHVLFAGLNEPNAETQAKTNDLIKYEQVFIDAVRATGGNNAKRILIVQGPNTDIDNTNKYYTSMPTDPTPKALMMEVHFYPYQFCLMEEDASWGKRIFFWGADNHVSGTYAAYNAQTKDEESFVLAQFQKMKTQFVDKGYPVILGEYGVLWRNLKLTTPSIDDADCQTKHDNSVKLFHKVVNEYAINCGIIPFVWDTNGMNPKQSMDVINRSSRSIYNTHAMEGIKAGVAAGKWPF